MASDVRPKVDGPIPKPGPRPKKPPKGLRPIGKVGKARQADRLAKLRREPPRHDGKRQCYICLQWHEHVDLEHVIDSSRREDLARNPDNHRWADNDCNIRKKDGRLTEAEERRVQQATEEVLRMIDGMA